jgi:hypothetical protein
MRFFLIHVRSAILLPVLSIPFASLQNCSRKAYSGGWAKSRRREIFTSCISFERKEFIDLHECIDINQTKSHNA